MHEPLLKVDEAEAKAVAEAVAEVAKHYNVAPDPKTQAWINLALIVGTVYGPRGYMLYTGARPPNAVAPAASDDGIVVDWEAAVQALKPSGQTS